jgi:hypothetical protein
MNRYAIIIDGVVSNVIVWDGLTEWTEPEGAFVTQLTQVERCDIGDIWRPGSVPRFEAP